MMRIWASANQKGGVGKTTTALNLGALLAERGQRVLLVDLDPHGSLSAYFGVDPDHNDTGVAALFEHDGETLPLASLLLRTGVERLALMPAATTLATLDRRYAGKPGMGRILERALQRWQGRFDHVLIDCPPMLGVLMVNALACCQRLLIPVQTEFLALQGLQRMLHTLEMVGSSLGHVPDYTIVPTFFDTRTRASRLALESLQQDYTEELWPGVIPVDTKFRDASREGVPLPLLAPATRGVMAYRALLGYLLTISAPGVGPADEPYREAV